MRIKIAGPAHPSSINNEGQVVGYFQDVGGKNYAYLYDPLSSPSQLVDLNQLGIGGVPTGSTIRSALDINNWGVIVGSLEHKNGDRSGYAIDWAAERPVLDVLPDFGIGVDYGWRINDNGDILGVYQDTEGNLQGYLFNPGLYGGGVERNNDPRDFSGETPDLLLSVTRNPFASYLKFHSEAGPPR